LLASITSIGSHFRVTRNALATVGAEYPAASINRTEAPHFDLRAWSGAFAVAEERPDGVAHDVDFCDAGGDVLHRVCLTPTSDSARYVRWIATHQDQSVRPPANQFLVPPGRCQRRPTSWASRFMV
jgi:putative heme degradation protein